jgi:GH18 family chitinase
MMPARRLALALFFCLLSLSARAGLWITGYYPGYEEGVMPVSKIDFTTVTHVIHFCLLAETNGSINSSDNDLSPSACHALVSAAHGAGRQALICVGGAGSETGFLGATAPGNLPVFVKNLTNFMATYGYDGVDIDWEPFYSADTKLYTNFVNSLRSALNSFSPRKLITVAAPAYPSYGDSPTAEVMMFASVQSQLDQINIMTYDLSGPYPGWVSWFNSPIYDGGYMFPNTDELVPSVNGAVNNFSTNGVAAARLGVGLPFYGYVWTGGPGLTQPRQSWPSTNVPTVTTPTYAAIIGSYYQSNLYHWDNVAQAAYLSITNVPVANDMFVSYDDSQACQVKVSYARNQGLGGVMIWELSQDYLPSQPAGQQSPLVEALHQSLATPQITSAQVSDGILTFSFTSLPLASYRISWTGNLATGSWNTLTNNLAGTGGTLQITDTNATQTERFYRVQTPP